MSRFIEHSMNLNTVKHSQDDLHFRTEGVARISFLFRRREYKIMRLITHAMESKLSCSFSGGGKDRATRVMI